jgi:hypothetical protein
MPIFWDTASNSDPGGQPGRGSASNLQPDAKELFTDAGLMARIEGECKLTCDTFKFRRLLAAILGGQGPARLRYGARACCQRTAANACANGSGEGRWLHRIDRTGMGDSGYHQQVSRIIFCNRSFHLLATSIELFNLICRQFRRRRSLISIVRRPFSRIGERRSPDAPQDGSSNASSQGVREQNQRLTVRRSVKGK